MQYRKLGRTDIDVSVICLGTMTWGKQNTEEEAHQQLNYAFENGVNFIDAAEMYPVPPEKETAHLTETYLGTWQGLHQNRDKIILATKVSGPNDFLPWIRGGKVKFDRENIFSAVKASLQRLKTDYIDLYQLHWPDRNTNFFGQMGFTPGADPHATPIEEILDVLKEVQKQGLVRHFGLSNETPWGTMSFLQKADSLTAPRMVSVQNPYSLLNRTYEIGMAEVSHRENCGLLAYSPLGFGVLSGKYLDGKRPSDGRLTLFDRFTRYNSDKATRATEKYVSLAKESGLDPAQMALAFVNSRHFLTSNIIGATKMEQLKSNISSIDLVLSDDVLQEIEKIHHEITNPCP